MGEGKGMDKINMGSIRQCSRQNGKCCELSQGQGGVCFNVKTKK